MQLHSLGHVVLKVRDLERSVPFYKEVLGLKEVARNERRMVFFSVTDNHHDIAVIETDAQAPEAPAAAPGLAHLALKIEGGLDELREAKKWLEANGVEIDRSADHIATKSLYFRDPDGNQLEVFVESDPRVWHENPNIIGTRQPLHL